MVVLKLVNIFERCKNKKTGSFKHLNEKRWACFEILVYVYMYMYLSYILY